MGLGKTFQVSCLLTGLLKMGFVSRVLIIAPVSVIESWQREINNFVAPYIPRLTLDAVIADVPMKKRLKALRDCFISRNPRIIISSYQLVANMIEDFSNEGGESWDYVILDEGHVIKNTQTKTSKAIHQLRSHHKLLLTGTPIQNELTEFWSLLVSNFLTSLIYVAHTLPWH